MEWVRNRFVELVTIQRHRKLTKSELREFTESYQYVEQQMWKLALLKNWSYMAYETQDWDWQHEICAEIDKLGGE